ncbi:FtsZ/tubulin family protein [Budvicia aquatica]|uniref:Cell division protein FtsZ n=2 Tax=Budvicia aquatica TaxID=82979 RepID=A0A2C6DTH7_9GAMM|nr:hypothetical protein [Budvicia aquatica]PHI32003.1 hypothetical protein CRN84_23105 [Budvicia aquatica]
MKNQASPHQQKAAQRVSPKYTVFGLGQAGTRMIDYIAGSMPVGGHGLQFIAIDNDKAALEKTGIPNTIYVECPMSEKVIDPDIGKLAIQAVHPQINQWLIGTEIVFIVTGMGGSFGAAAATAIADIARTLNIMTVAMVAMPFYLEDSQHLAHSIQAATTLSHHVDTLVTLPNDRLITPVGLDIPLLEAFSADPEMLVQAVGNIINRLTCSTSSLGELPDIKRGLRGLGHSTLGLGMACGEHRAREAVEMALVSPLLGGAATLTINDVIIQITAGYSLTLQELETIAAAIRHTLPNNMPYTLGTVLDPMMDDPLYIIIFFKGLGSSNNPPVPALSRANSD